MIMMATTRDRRIDTGLLVLRLVIGVVFLAHGWQKIFDMGLSGVTAGFAQMGIPMPEVAAPLVAGVELVGGIALIFGLWTRVFAVALAIDMLGAMIFVHLQNGFFAPGGIEFTLTLCAACITLALAGAGAMSIDDSMRRRRVVELASIDDLVVRDRPQAEVKV
jgi:putative oxidoreductase